MTSQQQDDLGVVIIGRNEGERFRVSLASVLRQTARVVYVDSGSTDGSREWAREHGAEVLELDQELPFTAARARNAGWQRLCALYPEVRFVQFIDGDCEMNEAWIATARSHLLEHPRTAVACGRRRERHPEASVYNRLCDAEWNTPVGPARACGGDALMRLDALQTVAGFNASMIAGEEPELCYRLRAEGWGVERLPADMTVHDAAMHSWRQWWKRSQRAGFSFALGHHLHGSGPERYYAAEMRSILVWSLGPPLLALAAGLLHPLGFLLLLVYPAQVLRLRSRFLREGTIPRADCTAYALHCVLGKFPGLAGLIAFQRDRLLKRRSRLIEYK